MLLKFFTVVIVLNIFGGRSLTSSDKGCTVSGFWNLGRFTLCYSENFNVCLKNILQIFLAYFPHHEDKPPFLT